MLTLPSIKNILFYIVDATHILDDTHEKYRGKTSYVPITCFPVTNCATTHMITLHQQAHK